jgi:NAD-dependent dihydropyrimidine dehydrogenase PreA subunit
MITDIDSRKCTGCGTCVEVCPLDTLRLDAFTSNLPPCRGACPAGVPIREYISMLKLGKLEEAGRLIREALPFPAITGRICYHPCEAACARKSVDEAVNINGLERFVGDRWLGEKASPEPVLHAAKVAVVGSGPAGLSAAYFLAKMGYRVTVFEAAPKLGGSLRTKVPETRLPRNVIDSQVKYIRQMGVKFRTRKALGKELSLDGLDGLKDAGYNGVFVATGTPPIGLSRATREHLTSLDVETFQTLVPHIFVGGALVMGKVPLVKVIAAARQAAFSIARFLGHGEKGARERPAVENIPGRGMGKKPREKSKDPWTPDMAEREASRCLHCGARAYIAYPDDCMTCFECELECPSRAINVHPFKEEFPPTIDYSNVGKAG